MTIPRRLFAALVLAAGLAGCVGDSGGGASVSFDGSGNGSHDDKTRCDKDATIFSNGQVDKGQVDVRVTDGDGREAFRQEFDGGANMDARSLTGASGTWRIAATRSSDTLLGAEFSGHYTFNLSC
jgi:hypothetical protein